MASISEAIQLTVEARFLPAIFDASWKMDPIAAMFFRTSAKVERNGIGQGWKVLKTWVHGVAGGARFTGVQGPDITSGPDNFVYWKDLGSFPGYDETVSPAYQQTSLTLIQQEGNFVLPHQFLRMEKLSASIGSILAQNMKGLAKLVNQQEFAVTYSADASTYELAGLGDTSVNVSNETLGSNPTSVMKFDLGGTNATGRIHRFTQGMFVDLYDSTGTTIRNSGFFLIVDNVDPLARTLSIRRADGTTFQIDTVLNGGFSYNGASMDDDIIVIKDSVSTGPGILESFIADGVTRTDWFDIDVRRFGQYKSYRPSDINAVLTESTLNRHVGFFREAFTGAELNDAITTTGVLLGFIDGLDSYNPAVADQPGRFRYDRQGQVLKVEAGFDTFTYKFAGHPLAFHTSTFCEPGVIYAGKFKNGGLVRYIPPSLPGAKQSSQFGTELEFVGTMGGAGGGPGGIFTLLHTPDGGVSKFVQAPFLRQWNVWPSQPNFMRLGGITEVLG